MQYTQRILLAVLTLLLSACLLQAAELKLKNGDRITGEVLKREDGKLVFRSEILGELKIPEAQVASLDEGKGAVSVAKAPLPVPPPGARPAELTRLDHFRKNVKGTVEFGFNSQSGRKEALSLSLRAEAEYVRNASQFKLGGRYLYGEANDALNSDKREASFRWRRQMKPRLFFQYSTLYLNDRIKGIDTDLEQNGGLGFALVKTQRQMLNTGIGLTGQYRSNANGSERSVILGDVFQDYQFKITNRLVLKQEGRVQYSDMDQTNYSLVDNELVPASHQASSYKLRFNTALQGKVTDTISLNLRYEYEFDNTIIDPALRSDHRVTSSIGYLF